MMSNATKKEVCDVCVDEGVTRQVGEVWSEPGVCSYKQCRPGGYIDHQTCPVQEMRDGCWLIQGDLSQQFPFCCPRLECREESSSSSSSSSEDDEPDKYEDLEEDGDDGGDEFAFSNLESFNEDPDSSKPDSVNNKDKQTHVKSFDDIVNDAENYIKTLNKKREIRFKNKMSECEGTKVYNESTESGNRVYKTRENKTDLMLINGAQNVYIDKEDESVENDRGKTVVSDLNKESSEPKNINNNVSDLNKEFSEPKNVNNNDLENGPSKEEILNGELLKKVKYEGGYEDMKEALDILQEDVKICLKEGEAEIPAEALEGMDQMTYPYTFSEEFQKKLGPDEEFEECVETLKKEADELYEEGKDEFTFEEPEGFGNFVRFNDPNNPNFYEGDKDFDDDLEFLKNEANELNRMQRKDIEIEGLDIENNKKKWYDPLFESEYLSYQQPSNEENSTENRSTFFDDIENESNKSAEEKEYIRYCKEIDKEYTKSRKFDYTNYGFSTAGIEDYEDQKVYNKKYAASRRSMEQQPTYDFANELECPSDDSDLVVNLSARGQDHVFKGAISYPQSADTPAASQSHNVYQYESAASITYPQSTETPAATQQDNLYQYDTAASITYPQPAETPSATQPDNLYQYDTAASITYPQPAETPSATQPDNLYQYDTAASITYPQPAETPSATQPDNLYQYDTAASITYPQPAETPSATQPDNLYQYDTAASIAYPQPAETPSATQPDNLYQNDTAASITYPQPAETPAATQPDNLYQYDTAASITYPQPAETPSATQPDNLYQYDTAASIAYPQPAETPSATQPDNLYQYETAANITYPQPAESPAATQPDNLYQYDTAASITYPQPAETPSATQPDNLYQYDTAASIAYPQPAETPSATQPDNLYQYDTAARGPDDVFSGAIAYPQPADTPEATQSDILSQHDGDEINDKQ